MYGVAYLPYTRCDIIHTRHIIKTSNTHVDPDPWPLPFVTGALHFQRCSDAIGAAQEYEGCGTIIRQVRILALLVALARPVRKHIYIYSYGI